MHQQLHCQPFLLLPLLLLVRLCVLCVPLVNHHGCHPPAWSRSTASVAASVAA